MSERLRSTGEGEGGWKEWWKKNKWLGWVAVGAIGVALFL